jgi:hypothetical protein
LANERPGEDAKSTRKSELQSPMMSKIDDGGVMRGFAESWNEDAEKGGCDQFVAVQEWYL